MNAKYLEISGRTYYAFEEPDFIGPIRAVRPEARSLSTVDKYNEGEIESKFCRRQFGRVVTSRQRKFDWFFGVIMPMICFYFDPIVFRESNWDCSAGNGLAGDYRTMVYVFCFVSIMTLAAFLLWGERLKWLNTTVAGVLFASALTALAIGVAIFPFSVLGLIVFIGILGFTPLLTTVVYARNAVRATRAAAPYFDKLTLFHIAALTGAAALVFPYVFGR